MGCTHTETLWGDGVGAFPQVVEKSWQNGTLFGKWAILKIFSFFLSFFFFPVYKKGKIWEKRLISAVIFIHSTNSLLHYFFFPFSLRYKVIKLQDPKGAHCSHASLFSHSWLLLFVSYTKNELFREQFSQIYWFPFTFSTHYIVINLRSDVQFTQFK